MNNNYILNRLQPCPKNSGFKMNDYFIWGGSLIKSGNIYHLFASRWPKDTGFPEGYRAHSEIVRATADNPLGPFKFQEVALKGRGNKWWDGLMCTNPKIFKYQNTFILYYIGTSIKSRHRRRKVGYAYSHNIEGPWIRLDKPLPLGKDHNNPAPYIHDNGSVLVAFRDQHLKMHIAKADNWNGKYRIVAKNVIPQARVEDPDMTFLNGKYYMLVEDNRAGLTGKDRFGAFLVSENCLKWKLSSSPIVYGHVIEWTDGTSITATRRERPELVNLTGENKKKGEPTHVITAILYKGETWCHIQPINEKDDNI